MSKLSVCAPPVSKLSVVLLVLAVAACDRVKSLQKHGPELLDAAAASPEAKGGGPHAGHEGARDALANARCQYLHSCGEIQTGKRYTSIQSCFAEEKKRFADDLAGCSAIDPTKVDACVAAWRAKTCDAFFVRTPDACEDTPCAK